MTRRVRLDLPLLLPGLPDARDACVGRLVALLEGRDGIESVHVHVPTAESSAPAPASPALCLHYDSDRIPLARVVALARAAGATVSARYAHEVFALRAIDSEDAGPRIEAALRTRPGILAASVNLAAQRVRVEYDREAASSADVEAVLAGFGHAAAPPHAGGCCGPRDPVPPSAGWYARNKELAWSVGAGIALAAAWAGERWAGLPAPAALVLYVVAYALGAWDLLRHWIGGLRRGRVEFNIDLLMLVAAAGAAALGQWIEGAFLLVLFSLAHALEHYATERARNAIKALAELAPATARVRRDGVTIEVPVEQVAVGETVLVRPAERIPVDGSVQAGSSAVDQAPITGESVPVEKAAGDPVFAGTVNGEGALEITTTAAPGDRTLDRVIRLVEDAQTQKAPTQQFTERFERIFVPIVLIADVLLIVVPALAGWWTWETSFYRGMALLVAASPCALALGTPSAVLAGIAQAARNGVLIKGGVHLENLGALRALAFDKTGTLTVGTPEVTDVAPSAGVGEQELLCVAAAVEAQSQHPLAAAVVRRAAADRLALPAAGELQSVTGRGVRSSVAGQPVEIGSLRLWEGGPAVPEAVRADVQRLQGAGRTTMVVRHGERWLGVLALADRPRPGVRETLDRLRALGLAPLVMLTGDNRGVGETIGREVGVDEVRAELLPEDKVEIVRDLLLRHGRVAMVGDGVNDAPALAHATVGIAMGGAGTAVALETADVALMGDDLDTLPFAVGLSRAARRVIRQNVAVSLGAIAFLVVGTTSGLIGIGPAVAGHEGSTLIVIGNALRLLAYRPRGTKGTRRPTGRAAAAVCLLLTAACAGPAAAQWRTGAEVGMHRYRGGSNAATVSGRGVEPMRTFDVGVRVERAFGAWTMALGGQHASIDVAITDPQDALVFRDQGSVWTLAPAVGRRLATLRANTLRGEVGPMMEWWRLTDRGRFRAGVHGSVTLDVPLASRLTGMIRSTIAVLPASVFEPRELPPGSSRRPLWRIGLSGGLLWRP